MIPKIIHYCWFGHNNMPEINQKCMQSWKKFCPDYEIILWNEDNFDLSSAPRYVRQACELNKWAYATDYIRLWIVYHFGGIYLDTDVELVRSLDDLLECKAFFGFEEFTRLTVTEEYYVNTGLGFGAEKGCQVLQEMMDEYLNISFFVDDGGYDKTPCTRRNTPALVNRGMIPNGRLQTLNGDIIIYPPDWFCPMDFECGIVECTNNTYSIHYFQASCFSASSKLVYRKQKYYIKKYGIEKGHQKAIRWTKNNRWLLRLLYIREKGLTNTIRLVIERMSKTQE